MMKILSIDWDFFYPDSFPYDWGHKETMFFLEALWSIRLTCHNQGTGAEAFGEYIPTIPKDFWKRVIKKSLPIFVAESHASIASLPFTKAIITNLDAHHDAGYSDTSELGCGNWAWHLRNRIKEYHLCYPEWRRADGEGTMSSGYPKRKPDSITYGLPSPADYDMAFVCRSGCWTPPWFDRKFYRWLKQSGSGCLVQPIDDLVWKIRSPSTLAEARVMKDSQMKDFEKLKRKVA